MSTRRGLWGQLLVVLAAGGALRGLPPPAAVPPLPSAGADFWITATTTTGYWSLRSATAPIRTTDLEGLRVGISAALLNGLARDRMRLETALREPA